MSGVYAIVHRDSGTTYIGSTIRSFAHRKCEHLYDLRNNNHTNPHLQRAWNKYGEDAFCFQELEKIFK